MIYRKRRSLLVPAVKALLCVLPFFLVFSIIWLRSNVTAFEYELGQLQKQKASLIEERRELIAKRARMASMQKIQYVASKKMGLAYPDRKRIFFVKTDRGPTPYRAGLRN